MEIPSAFETVGHIAHLNLREEQLPFKKVIGQARCVRACGAGVPGGCACLAQPLRLTPSPPPATT